MRHVILRKITIAICVLIGFVSWVVVGQIPCEVECFDGTLKIANGTANSPLVYRILTPGLLVALGNTLTVHLAYYAVGLVILFVLLDRWFARWHLPPTALLLVALMLPIFFHAWWIASYTLTEWILLLCGLLLLMPRWLSSGRSTEK